ncbi:OmpH family outer membrane protein [Victivallis sp. Marseille-Q1083]|uniref:OmpH family outer membrane protein n=1 Tax=Victivallis sp. Marseille-Q1083 TaxID=2717288 RepID=UPI00158A5B56|nr:OmpH family outer membrane protein [Victivallis sp. Marseille-Q1083]
MKKLLFLLGLVLAVGLSAAEQKIAVIDMEKVFRGFYKTKIAETYLQQQQDVYIGYLNRLKESYTKIENEYVLLRDASQNLALSPTERESKRLEAQKKYQDMQAKRAEIEQYAMSSQKQFSELERKKNDEIVTEIKTEVTKRAAVSGYTFVLDCSGKNSNAVTAVVYFDPATDITDAVLEALNRGNQPREAKDDNTATEQK